MKKFFLILFFWSSLVVSGCGENETNCNRYDGDNYWYTPLYHCHCPEAPEKIKRRCGHETYKYQKNVDERANVQNYSQLQEKGETR
ncbi:MAG: hypothetical protein ABFD79_09355 [Phycisphaerales bacterium]